MKALGKSPSQLDSIEFDLTLPGERTRKEH